MHAVQLDSGKTRRALAYACAAAAVLIICRSLVWVVFEQSFFDSDQAITGLMAKQLAEGRAFPLLFYGQHYMLGVEAWLAAPVFLVAGASVFTLKLPLVAINVAIGCLLLWMLVRHEQVSVGEAFLIAMFFIVPAPLVAARFVEAQGGNIEPLLYVLLLWLLRKRPIAFGLLAGFAFFHREFAAYAIAGVIALDVLTGRAVARGRLREYLMAWGAFALVALALTFLKPHADLLGPGTAQLNEGGLDAQVANWNQFVCWPPTEAGINLSWLAHENLGTIFNWKADALGPDGWAKTPMGYTWMWVPLLLMAGVAAVEVLRRRKALGDRWEFGTYLMIVGVQAAFAYAVLGCHVRDDALIRYTLLTIYFPIGLLTLFALAKPARWARGLVFGVVIVWAALAAVDNGRFLAAYVHRPPPSEARELANFLQAQGVRYARGTYWVAYLLDFLTKEHITVSSLDKVRVLEYQKIVDAHDQQLVQITPNRHWPDGGCDVGIPYRLWCLQYLDRARSASAPNQVQTEK